MNKKVILGLLAALLSACVIPGVEYLPISSANPTDADTATRVSQLLTAMPTITPDAPQQDSPSPTMLEPSPTAEKPAASLEPQNTTAPSEPVSPTYTPTAAPPTDVRQPQATPTITGIPKVEPTFLNKSIEEPTATRTVSPQDPRLRFGSPASTDNMDKPDTWGWPTESDGFSNVSFNNGLMNLVSLKTQFGWRLPLQDPAKNIYLEMTARTGSCSAKDSYGMIVRVPVYREPKQGYVFAASCDGSFRVFKWDGKSGPNGTATNLISWKENSAINKGANQTNRLGILTYGSRILVYANGTLLGETSDSSFGSGYFGAVIYRNKTTNFTVNIDSMSYWLNAKP